MTTQTTPVLGELFDGGPPRGLETALGLVKPDKPRTISRAGLISVVVWAPLILLASVQSLAIGEDKLTGLLLDFALHARNLVAVPLFILAESFTLSTLGKTARHSVEAELIRDQDRPRFESIAAGIRRLLNSKSSRSWS